MAHPKPLKISPRRSVLRRRVNLVQAVVDRLQGEILANGRGAGNKLPSEGQLCETFGVSHTVMREVMRTLAERGLIEVSQGQVARVREPDSMVVEDSLDTFLRRGDYSPLVLMEVRCPLETEAAALAAERATPDQIAELRKCLEPLRTATTIKAQIVAELRFHESLVAASGNPLFLVLQRTLTKLMVQWLTAGMKSRGLDRSEIDYHEPIVKAIERRDPVAARNCLREHFRDAVGKAEKLLDK